MCGLSNLSESQFPDREKQRGTGTHESRHGPGETLVCIVDVEVRDAGLRLFDDRPVAPVPAIDAAVQRVLTY